MTNTFVPRDTKTLVAGVSAKRLAEPQAVNHILDSIQAISDEARSLLGGGKPVERAILVKRLEALIKENHVHLVNLGVSHPSLEMIVAATAQAPFELATKLTGAGGGGCALTLIPDGKYSYVVIKSMLIVYMSTQISLNLPSTSSSRPSKAMVSKRTSLHWAALVSVS